jgi:glycogen operon protein
VRGGQPDWSAGSRLLALTRSSGNTWIYLAANAHWEARDLELPRPAAGLSWHLVADTAADSPHDIHPPGDERPLTVQDRYLIEPRSTVILLARPTTQS